MSAYFIYNEDDGDEYLGINLHAEHYNAYK